METGTQAWISDRARIAPGVKIGMGTRIHDHVEVGEGSVIGDHCVLGHPAGGAFAGKTLQIGPGSIIRSHSVLYEGSRFGARLETGHHVLIREGIRAGKGFRVGSFSDLEGDCEIGEFCRFHSYVHVGRGSRVGNFVWIYSQNTLTNDPLPPSHLPHPIVIEDGVVICVSAFLMPGAHLRRGAYISSGARVGGVVPPGAVISGENGRVIGHVSGLMDLQSGTRHPWMGHFADAYPEEARPAISKLKDEIAKDKSEFMKWVAESK